MDPTVASLNYWLSFGTILLQIVTGVLFVLSILTKRNALTEKIESHGLLLIFLLSAGSAAMTLLYSDVFGFVPCGLCWFERIFLYPVVIISGIALWKKKRDVADYILGLSIPGAVIALYHHYVQMGGSEFIACPVSGVSCAKRIIFEFDYVTFPLMAFTLFVCIVVVALYLRRNHVS